MTWFDYIWRDGDGHNVEHIAQHGITPDEVEHVIENPVEESVSRSSGRPIRFGYTDDGRYIGVVFEYVDDVTVMPVTAFVVGEN